MQQTKSGSLSVIVGSMGAGKSEELIRRIRRVLIAHRVCQVFKPSLDSRYFGINRISTHNGTCVEAVPIRFASDILHHLRSETEVVAVDEVQFLDGVVTVLNELANRGLQVIAAGTDTDFRGEPFGEMGTLVTTADQVDKLTAICVQCGGVATRNQRLVDGLPAPYESAIIQVGGFESYESRCRHCHQVPRAADLLDGPNALPFDAVLESELQLDETTQD